MNRYYREELAKLKTLAAEFAAAQPALAPMLGGPCADPDVELLLEGVAYQSGLLRAKLDQDFPELVQELARLVCPQHLRPVPSATIVVFAPTAGLAGSRLIPAGTQLASLPVEGTRCLFRTCSEVELLPLELVDVSFGQPAGRAPAVTLSLNLLAPLADRPPRPLRLFLADDYPAAADLYLLLRRQLRRIVLIPADGGGEVILSLDALRFGGFSDEEALIPFPPGTLPGERLWLEYFLMPQRFLFLDLCGWERGSGRGSGGRFSVRFELVPGALPPRVRRESFLLYAAPAVNLFPLDARPLLLDHRRERYLLRPDALPPEHAQIFSVDRVTGTLPGTDRHRSYFPAPYCRPASLKEPLYSTIVGRSPAGGGCDLYLSVGYPAGEGLPEPETLSVELTCSNGGLAERLRVGDLCRLADGSPGPVTVGNVTAVTPQLPPLLSGELLGRLLSRLTLNRQPLASAEGLQAALSLQLPGPAAAAGNRRRLDGIAELVCRERGRLIRGVPMRGRAFRVLVQGDHFAGAGDLFLFGCLLDRFLAGRNLHVAATPRPTDALRECLASRAHEFSFLQAVRLLRLVAENADAEGGASWRGAPDLDLSFPAADLSRIELDAHGYRLRASFLGLYGQASPLPTFYSEELWEESSADACATREFLDLVNQRLFALCHDALLKYRLSWQLAEEGGGECLERLSCLLGLGEGEPGRELPTSRALLPYAGLFSLKPRSAAALASLLGDLLRLPVTVLQCVERRVPVPLEQRLRLGDAAGRLGEDAVLGCQVPDRSGAFRLRLGPLDRERFSSLLPETPGRHALEEVVDIYLEEPLVWEVELLPKAGEAPAAVLGVAGRLGWDLWLAPEGARTGNQLVSAGRAVAERKRANSSPSFA